MCLGWQALEGKKENRQVVIHYNRKCQMTLASNTRGFIIYILFFTYIHTCIFIGFKITATDQLTLEVLFVY